MNRGYSRFDSFASILAGTVTVAAIVVFAPATVFAKTPQEIAQLAISATVQINSQYPNGAIGSGSGFIIAKQGTTYTVLAANHVVDDTKAPIRFAVTREKTIQ
jgi:serine protease Do